MIVPEALLTFIVASALLSLAPGPDNIFVLTQSAQYGGKSGLAITLGLCTGLIVHTTAVALGVAALFKTSVMAFTILKTLGAVYLLYLAWLAFRSKAAGIGPEGPDRLPLSRLYRRGILMNITNPKVSIFFLAFLPQFASPSNGSIALQIFVLGAVFIAVALIVFSLIATLAGTIGDWLRNSTKAQNWLNRIAGTVFAALALKLITAEI